MSAGAGEAARPSRRRAYLLLGRVSNLPTVWTNCMAGLLLASGATQPGALSSLLAAPSSLLAAPSSLLAALPSLLAAMSCFYVGGMFLNDAFDHRFDREHRPERPIPTGVVGLGEVFAVGFGLLVVGEALLALPALLSGMAPAPAPLLGGLVLALLIVYYNYRHKTDPLSPLVMALCRAMVYVIAAAGVAWPLPLTVWGGAGVLVSYLIGLTYVAKQENLQEVKNLWPLLFLAAPFAYAAGLLPLLSWGVALYAALLAWVIYGLSFLLRREGRSIPRAVVSLIAGISLLDGLLMAHAGAPPLWGALAAAGFALTLLLQRFVPGT